MRRKTNIQSLNSTYQTNVLSPIHFHPFYRKQCAARANSSQSAPASFQISLHRRRHNLRKEALRCLIRILHWWWGWHRSAVSRSLIRSRPSSSPSGITIKRYSSHWPKSYKKRMAYRRFCTRKTYQMRWWSKTAWVRVRVVKPSLAAFFMSARARQTWTSNPVQ